ncbi:hypothetical protein B0H19DRAFT_1264716 [Mycena capillaripes]|nr:hypothetical protein B0H19DRAFT_1264716 [Mycena capillaripes]
MLPRTYTDSNRGAARPRSGSKIRAPERQNPQRRSQKLWGVDEDADNVVSIATFLPGDAPIPIGSDSEEVSPAEDGPRVLRAEDSTVAGWYCHIRRHRSRRRPQEVRRIVSYVMYTCLDLLIVDVVKFEHYSYLCLSSFLPSSLSLPRLGCFLSFRDTDVFIDY